MISTRTQIILRHIVDEYITRAAPVASQYIAGDPELRVSPATIRNEMMRLEQEGYIIRPHTSAGGVPSDKGYRFYVDTLHVKLLPEQQRLISHLFHQAEKEIDNWLSLTATLLSRMVENVAVVSLPKPPDCKFRHMEAIVLQDRMALVVLVLYGARVKQQLITLDQAVSQPRLTVISSRLNEAYAGLTGQRIMASSLELLPAEKQITDALVAMMRTEDEREYEEPYLDGLHFMLNQPEFHRNEQMSVLLALIEQRQLLKTIAPGELGRGAVHVIIGKENKAEAVHDYSVVISQYGLPDEATGSIGVIGPTRMRYADAIPMVDYLATVLSELMAVLYGKDRPGENRG